MWVKSDWLLWIDFIRCQRKASWQWRDAFSLVFSRGHRRALVSGKDVSGTLAQLVNRPRVDCSTSVQLCPWESWQPWLRSYSPSDYCEHLKFEVASGLSLATFLTHLLDLQRVLPPLWYDCLWLPRPRVTSDSCLRSTLRGLCCQICSLGGSGTLSLSSMNFEPVSKLAHLLLSRTKDQVFVKEVDLQLSCPLLSAY